MSAVLFFPYLAGSYLLGAVPFGYLIGRARGLDVREHGSGNIGATNVGRVIGRKWGYVCLVLDILKGFAATFIASFVLSDGEPTTTALLQWMLIGLAAVAGHVWPVYLKLRGGKGVATTVGVALGIFPHCTLPMLAALAVYGVIRRATGWVSAGSLAIAVVFPISFLVYVWTTDLTMSVFWPLQTATVVLGLLIIVRHRSNIARLFRGEEDKVGEASEANPRA